MDLKDKERGPTPPKKEEEKPPRPQNPFIWVILALALVGFLRLMQASLDNQFPEISYGRFYQDVRAGKIKDGLIYPDAIRGDYLDGKGYRVNIPANDQELWRLIRENPDFQIRPPQTFWMGILQIFGPIILLVAVFWFFFYRGAQQAGGRVLAFGKSRARQSLPGGERITFDDVAGVDEAKEELQEIIEFLKDPRKFQRLGGKIPKGVLLMGPPGSGKTLLAKAVAGEAGVPFFSISGSDFVEMFVGVGASRVRDLFDQAKKSVRATGHGCIIFIDEIDAVGRQRFAGIGGGHDEREQTLNALLVEMDGFDTQKGIILIAATNRPDVLDPALLRPGRFDRQIVILQPDIVGREGILKVHTRNIKLAKTVDLKSLARQTPGFSGADLANLVNEAALLAARRNKKEVDYQEMEESIERVMAGPQRKSRIISKEEKKIIAYHEAGHGLLALLIPGADPLHKISLISRGMALGYTLQLPKQDRYITTKKQYLGQITGLLGGRASEEINFEELTTGAYSDLKLATEIARSMVTQFGMSKKLGHLTFGKRPEQIFLGRDIIDERNYSDKTALLIDEEVSRIIAGCYEDAKKTLEKNKEKLKLLAETLLEKEAMNEGEVKTLLGLDKGEPEKKSEG